MKEDHSIDNLIPDYESALSLNLSKLKGLIDEIRERSYRRGVTHGYSFGMSHCGSSKDENIKKIMEKIYLWSRDIKKTGGVPCTYFEEIQMYFPKD
jgi:hypothetical protein